MYSNYKQNNRLINNASIHKKAYCHNPFNAKNPRLNLGLINAFKKIKIPKTPKVSWVAIKFLLIVITVLGLMYWSLFLSSWFEIKKINVNFQDLHYVDSGLVEDLAQEQLLHKKMFFSQKYFFTFSKSDFLDVLKKQWLIDDIVIKNNFLTNSLSVNIVEKKLDLTWCESESCFYLDRSGLIITKAPASELAIYNTGLNRIIDNKMQIDLVSIDFIHKLLLNNKIGDFKVRRYFVDNDLRSVKLNLLNGPEVYFNIDENIDSQINSLNLFLKEKVRQDEIKNITYIDLRYGDKIFYK